MGRNALLVMGPAGAGKTTLCNSLVTHMAASRRHARLLNLDPAAENFENEPDGDIKDLIALEDVMETLEFGPNGGLVYCLEYLLENIDWLDRTVCPDADDDYWIIDCPGQIELYTHFPIMRNLVTHLTSRLSFNVCGIYCIESSFAIDPCKFFSACLCAMSAMIQLEIPNVNAFTKIDLIKGQMTERELDRFLWPDTSLMEEWISKDGGRFSPKWERLNQAVTQLIDSYDMIAFTPIDITDEDSLEVLVAKLDRALQYGEDLEPKEINEADED